MKNRVLIIDDDKELCTLMKKCLEQEDLSAIRTEKSHRIEICNKLIAGIINKVILN